MTDFSEVSRLLAAEVRQRIDQGATDEDLAGFLERVLDLGAESVREGEAVLERVRAELDHGLELLAAELPAPHVDRVLEVLARGAGVEMAGGETR